MEFETGRIDNVGGRTSNQDYAGFVILEQEKAACWVVADGLGGHLGGETASKTAVEVILAAFKQNPGCSTEAVTQYLLAAQNELLRIQGQNPRLSQMRTTVVILVTDFERAIWGHIGDSRLYRLEDGKIRFQTRDHSVPQSMAAAGDIATDQVRHHEDRNRLLRSMGQPESFRPEIFEKKESLYDGDVFLLCTDGFWEYVEEPEMEIDFAKAKNSTEWLYKMEGRILKRAEGEFDNYTAIAVYCHSSTRPRPSRTTIPPHTKPIPAKAAAKETVTPPTPTPTNLKRIVFSLIIIAELMVLAYLLFIVKIIRTPADLIHSKRVYNPVHKALYFSLDEAVKEAGEREEIWIGPGYFYSNYALKAKNKKLLLKGAGLDKTYLFVNPGGKMFNISCEIFGKIPGLITGFVEMYQMGSILSDFSTTVEKSISVFFINDEMKILGMWPPETPINKKEVQKKLYGLASFFESIRRIPGKVMNPGIPPVKKMI
jgi:serine/threonine protein phosphatase PrpC